MRELARASLGGQGGDLGDLLAHLIRTEDGAHRTLLVVDQMEEVWTACEDQGEREAFVGTLVELLGDPRSSASVVLALRADYVAAAAEHTELAALMADCTLLVGSPTPAEIERAITRPAARAGLALEEGLAETMVDEAGNEPGLLPLLSVALTQLWDQRADERLTYAGYVAVGGIAGAIATLAETVWSDLIGRRPVGGPGAAAEARRARGRPWRRTTAGAAGGDRGPVSAWASSRPGTPRRRPVADGRGRSRRGRPRGVVPRVATTPGLAGRRCCGARGPASPRGRRVGVGE